MTTCSCWVEYPNEAHKNKCGTWKCVDKYECIRDLEVRHHRLNNGLEFEVPIKKTLCVRKEQ